MKIFVEQNSPEPKVKAYVPMYEPLEVTECKKCGNVIAEPKELILLFFMKKLPHFCMIRKPFMRRST